MPTIDPGALLQPAIYSLFDNLLGAPPLGRDLYLDPGSGSYLLQLLIAALVGSAFMIRTFWSRIIGFFKGNPGNDETDSQDNEK